MSLAKSIAGFIISSLFIIFLYLTITSYTLGNSLQRENVKEFVQSRLNGETASSTCDNVCSTESTLQQCEDYCNYVNVSLRQSCRDQCISSSQDPQMKQACIQSCLSKSNESQQNIFNTIDDIYSKKLVAEFSLDDVLSILKNFLLFLIVSIILGVSLFLVSEKPLSRIGNDLVIVAISSLA
jgi:hypothetical protein